MNGWAVLGLLAVALILAAADALGSRRGGGGIREKDARLARKAKKDRS